MMDTLVLMVTIWPNLEKGWMVVMVSGMAATMVVSALDVIETPMCDTATRVRHLRVRDSSCKKEDRWSNYGPNISMAMHNKGS